MWVILGASIVAVAVFLERIYEYRKMGVPLDPFLDGINALVRRDATPKPWNVVTRPMVRPYGSCRRPY